MFWLFCSLKKYYFELFLHLFTSGPKQEVSFRGLKWCDLWGYEHLILPEFDKFILYSHQFSSVQSLRCIWLIVTPQTAACQASLSITNSQSLLKLMSIESVMPSNHLILYCPPLLLQSSGSFPMSQFFASGRQSIRASASAPVLPMNIQDWFPLGSTGWISLQFKSINSSALSFLYGLTLTSIHDYWKNHSFD